MLLLPESWKFVFTRADRESLRNCKELRSVFAELVQKKKQTLNMQGENDNSRDIVSILLQDDLFKDNESVILDECLTFFFAGSSTTSA